MASNRNRSDLPSSFQADIKAMIAGFGNALPTTVTSLNVNGASLTPAQIQSKLDAIELVLTSVDVAKTAYVEAVASRTTALPGDKTFYVGPVSALRGLFGASPTQLVGFGVGLPMVRAKLTADQAAIAKAKSKATRALRGTMGPKQRAAVTLEGQSTLQVLGPDGEPLNPSFGPGAGSNPAPATPAAPAAPATVAPTTAGD